MVWVSDGANASATATRELVLPTGAMHLVVRVSDHLLRIFDDLDDRLGNVVSTAVVGGARTAPYIRDISEPTRSVGAQRVHHCAAPDGADQTDLAAIEPFM